MHQQPQDTRIEIRSSAIHRLGAHALSIFKAGAIVLAPDTSVRLNADESAALPEADRQYLHPCADNRPLVQEPPERFVNHSCEPNTEVIDFCLVASRDIGIGEEITCNYELDGAGGYFECTCGSPTCRGMIGAQMQLHRIDPEPSVLILTACAQSEQAAEMVQAMQALYQRKGFVLPWVGYLARERGQFVGSCAFAAPAAAGEAEIAYVTFSGFEGTGVATRMAQALMALARKCSDERFIAHTLPEESPSTSILRKLGFVCLGAIQHPEDGPVWKWCEQRGGGLGTP